MRFAAATELIAGYRSKTLSPVQVVADALEAVSQHEPSINAFRVVDAEGAMTAARASERRWHRGEQLGPLDGVPVSVKDLLLVSGWPTLRGSRLVKADQAWDEDSPSVACFRSAGAILLGKTNTSEFGWKGTTDSPLAGVTRNPWNLALTPGGSSGGASAALAAGMGTLALGTDGGGSIRNPASFTNLCGLKATYGRIPFYPASPMGTLSNVGLMARCVADVALMLDITAWPDARDPHALPRSVSNWSELLHQSISGLRVAYSPALGFAKIDPEVFRCVADAAKLLSDLGAVVDECDPPIGNVADLFTTHWYVGAAAAFRGVPEAALALLDPGLDKAIAAGAAIDVLDFAAAQNERSALAQKMNLFHKTYDLLITPMVSVPAFPAHRRAPPGIEEDDFAGWSPFSYPFNLTMQPAMSVPCGFTKSGLPVGLQIVAAMHREDLVLRAAAEFEKACPLYNRHPDGMSV